MSIPTPPRQTRRLHAGLKWGSLGWGKPDWGKPDWGKPDWGSPVWPLAAAALLGPFVAVLQSKAMAPLALVVLVAVLGMARRRQGRWPLPSGAALWAGLALAGWGMLSGLWSPGPLRALHAGLTLGGLMLLAGAAGRAVAAEPGAPRLLGRALLAGLSLGLAAALADSASGSALRAAVRGLREVPPQLVFGLKPAASVMALLLPLLAALPWPGPRSGPRSGPWPRAMRSLLLLAGTALLLLAPGDTAKLAALAGLVVALLALWLPAGGRQVMGWLLGAGMAGVLLATPPLLGLLLREVPPVVERLPPSAIHRLVIWQFGLERAAEKPLAGWGMEAARALPGGEDQPERARLEALGLRSPALFGWFTAMRSTLMPLHPHNGPLQIRLELGLVGSALAALALLLLAGRAAGGEGVPPAAALGAMASGFVTFLASFGAWQPWWLCSLALALALARGLAGGGSSAAGARAGEQP